MGCLGEMDLERKEPICLVEEKVGISKKISEMEDKKVSSTTFLVGDKVIEIEKVSKVESNDMDCIQKKTRSRKRGGKMVKLSDLPTLDLTEFEEILSENRAHNFSMFSKPGTFVNR